MDSNRRAFLIQSGSVVGVIGLGYLLTGQPAPLSGALADASRPPTAKPATPLLKAALERMRAENKPGVAIRIPADREKRHTPGHALLALLNRPEPGSIRLFAQAVFICLESTVVQDQLAGAVASHDLVLFDAERRAIAGVSFDYEGNWGCLAPELLGLVQGGGESRLKARAESIRRKADPSLVEAVYRLGDDDERDRVARHAPTIAPLLVYEELQPTNEARKKALSAILSKYVDSSSPTAPGPNLPFGVEASSLHGGCGDDCRERSEQQRAIAVDCGMGRVGAKFRSFVRYLAS